MDTPGDPPGRPFGDPVPEDARPSVVGLWRAGPDGGLHEGGTVAYWRNLAHWLLAGLVVALLLLVVAGVALTGA